MMPPNNIPINGDIVVGPGLEHFMVVNVMGDIPGEMVVEVVTLRPKGRAQQIRKFPDDRLIVMDRDHAF